MDFLNAGDFDTKIYFVFKFTILVLLVNKVGVQKIPILQSTLLKKTSLELNQYKEIT